jgi:hypothetical protein
MFRTLRPYFVVLLFIWLGLGVAANIEAHKYPASSHWIMTGVLPAFLFESVFFVAAGFEQTRRLFAEIPGTWLQSLLLLASSIVPFLIVALTGRTLDSHSLVVLIGLNAVISFWWALFPPRTAYDIGFLTIAAAPFVLRVFSRLYVSPEPDLEISILGHLMWIRIALLGLLVQRGFELGPVGFWPKRPEWREGILQFAVAIVPLSLIAMWVHFVTFAPKNFAPWRWVVFALGQFLGILCVVAFSEDVFRSVITRLFFRFGRTAAVAAMGSAIAVGCAHLWYHDFPNWRYAIVATVAHFSFTVAYLRGGSVRASMVTHALTVTTWRMLFHS